jgi:predicted transcriptional regulator
MKAKFSLPKRVYCDGSKKMISMRLPERLWAELEKTAEAHGWTTTDVVTTALDEFVQWSRAQANKKKA